jgi:hypothetical protein
VLSYRSASVPTFLQLIAAVNRKSLASWGQATSDFVILMPLL